VLLVHVVRQTPVPQANGAHPYFVTPEHTARAREILGRGPWLCPEQMVLLETNPAIRNGMEKMGFRVYKTLRMYDKAI